LRPPVSILIQPTFKHPAKTDVDLLYQHNQYAAAAGLMVFNYAGQSSGRPVHVWLSSEVPVLANADANITSSRVDVTTLFIGRTERQFDSWITH